MTTIKQHPLRFKSIQSINTMTLVVLTKNHTVIHRAIFYLTFFSKSEIFCGEIGDLLRDRQEGW